MSKGRLRIAAAFVWTMMLAGAAAAPQVLLWRDPGLPEQFDFAGTFDPSLKPPTPPFRFAQEDSSGTQPKLLVRDANGSQWNVKFGFEVKAESFAWRIIRACGYFVEPNFFVAGGRIEGMPAQLRRPTQSVQPDGTFSNARFQIRDPRVRFVAGQSWHWTENNPFRDTQELKGLRLLLMLVSNYDNKDARVGAAGGPNTGVFEVADRAGSTRWLSFTDWGSTMGHWGHLSGQSDWNCTDFAAQTTDFVRGVRDGRVVFGFEGHIPEFNDGITPADVRWLLARLGRITDAQIRAGLASSGASVAEIDCFGKALRARITALERVALQ